MNMAQVAAAADFLDHALSDLRVDRVRGEPTEPHNIVLHLGTRNIDYDLLISVDPKLSRAHLTFSPRKAPREPSAFVMLLRKHLVGARIDHVALVNNDRILEFVFSVDRQTDNGHRRHGGNKPGFSLLAELTGRHGNLFLLDHARQILGSMLGNRSAVRDLNTQQTYVPPSRRPTQNPPTQSPPTQGPHAQSPLTQGPPAQGPPAQGPPTPAGSDAEDRSLAIGVDGTIDGPTQQGDPSGAHHVPRTLDAGLAKQRTLDEDFRRAESERASTALFDAALRPVTQALKATKRKIKALYRDAARTDEAAKWTHWGILLQSMYGRVPRGAASVSVPDYTLPDAAPVEIPLEPRFDLSTNINKYFHKSKRMRRGADKVLERIEATEVELHALQSLRDSIPTADEPDKLVAEAGKRLPSLRRVLQHAASSNANLRAAAKGDAKPTRLPYRTFKASNGWDLLVGRGGADNDALTFKVGRGNDLWMHAEDWAGAHVIVRTPKNTIVPRLVLEEAALLTAFYSKGKNDSVVSVRYTQRKNVRKPKGMPPGRVTIAGTAAIDIRLDDPRLQLLLQQGAV